MALWPCPSSPGNEIDGAALLGEAGAGTTGAAGAAGTAGAVTAFGAIFRLTSLSVTQLKKSGPNF